MARIEDARVQQIGGRTFQQSGGRIRRGSALRDRDLCGIPPRRQNAELLPAAAYARDLRFERSAKRAQRRPRKRRVRLPQMCTPAARLDAFAHDRRRPVHDRIHGSVLQREPVRIERVARRDRPASADSGDVETPVVDLLHVAQVVHVLCVAGVAHIASGPVCIETREPRAHRRPQHHHADDCGVRSRARIHSESETAARMQCGMAFAKRKKKRNL